MINRILAFLILVALLLSSAACGGSGGPPSVESVKLVRGESEDVGTTFKPNDNPLRAVVKIANPKEGTKVRGVWTVVDAGGEKNFKLPEKELVLQNIQNTVDFTVTLPQEWPTGKYKFEVFINDTLEKTVDFTIQ